MRIVFASRSLLHILRDINFARSNMATIVSVDEKTFAETRASWISGGPDKLNTLKSSLPLPQEGKKNFLVCSALPYVNNVPHLGNIIGCVLSADCFARYCRISDINVLYVCGTDEYGTATEKKALEEKCTPKEICDKYNAIHKRIYDWFRIDFDIFGRTTTEDQTIVCQDIFTKNSKNSFTESGSLTQLFCENCKMFLADRFVEGSCPLCQSNDARGDQCDGCGQLMNAIDLINPKCMVCNQIPVIKATNHLFLKLDTLHEKVEGHLSKLGIMDDTEAKNDLVWSDTAKQITRGWLKGGLKPRCITRDLKWGTPCPAEGFTDKVFYVWFDAPIGYISMTRHAPFADKDDWKKWWQNPEQVQLWHFLGKDNVAFHSVMFPAELLGTGDPWTLVSNISATEFLNYEGGKFSKSRGTGVFGDAAESCGIDADIFRWYLLSVRPESKDATFSWAHLADRNNNELLGNLGNFVNRALSFIKSRFDGKIPLDADEFELTDYDVEALTAFNGHLAGFSSAMRRCKMIDAASEVLSASRIGNQYFQASAPWKTLKTDKSRCAATVTLAANMAAALVPLMHPFMPGYAANLASQLRLTPERAATLSTTCSCVLPKGHELGDVRPMFATIDDAQVESLRSRFGGGQQVEPGATAATIACDVKNGATGKPAQGKKKKVSVDDEIKQCLAQLSIVDNDISADKEALTLQGDVVKSLKTTDESQLAGDALATHKEGIAREVKKLLGMKQDLLKKLKSKTAVASSG